MKLTQEAYKKAADELAYRKNVLAPKLGALIVESAAQGDGIHDNVQLRDTRDEIQVNLDAIARLEDVIRASDNTSENESGKVQMGSIVKIQDTSTNAVKEVQIVNSDALNFVSNAVTEQSPIGSALIGKKKRDKVKVILPNGNIKTFEIIEIK